MANKERGELRITVGDQDYILKLATWACAEIEDVFGKLWDDVITGVNRGSLKSTMVFLWAALREYHPEIASDDPKSLKDVAGWVDRAGGLPGLNAKVKALVELNAPPEEEQQATGAPGSPLANTAPIGVDSMETPLVGV